MSGIVALPSVQRTDIDGVPVFWNERPGPLSASLVFGVGLAHETFLQTGITRLLGHLAARPTVTTTTEMLHTSFEISGSPEMIAGQLQRICESLSNLDTGPLDLARGVLQSEPGPGVTAWLPSSIWFGNRAFGLAGTARIAPVRASAADVHDWAARWFHRGNAAVVLSAPPPADLRLPLAVLPDGRRPEPLVAKPFDLATPAYTTIPNGFAGCALVDWTPGMACAAGILTTRLRRLGYDIAFDHQAVGGGRAVLGFGADVPDHDVKRVLDMARAELGSLAASGPSTGELDADRAALRDQLGDRGFAGYRALDEALSELTGRPSATTHQQAVLAGISVPVVAAAAAELAGGLVLCAPQQHTPGDLPELPGSPLAPVPGRELKRALVGGMAPRGYRLVVGADGLTAYYGPSPVPVAVVRFDDLAGVGIENTDGRRPILHLFGLHGGMITLRPGDWRGGRALVDQLLTRAGPEMCFEAPEAMRLFEQS